MRFFKILFIIFFLCFSFVAPYKAYFSHKPLLINQSLTIEDGSTINMVISEITPQNIFNKLYLKIFLLINEIDTLKSGEYKIYQKSLKEIINDMNQGNTITHKIVIKEVTIVGIKISFGIFILISLSFLKKNALAGISIK